MRIVYILNTLAVGGAERMVVALAEGMTARGNTVQILTVRAAVENELPAPVSVNHLGITHNPLSLPRGILRGLRALRSFQPDVIHANNFHGNLIARALRLFVPRATVVSTIHNVNEGGAARRLALRLSDGLSHRTAAVCEAAAEVAIRQRVVPRSKCTVIPNGINCAEFAPDARRRVQQRAQAGLGPEFVWLALGRLTPAKDYPNLLRGFAQVLACAANVRLWIAGEGEQQYTEQLYLQAAQLGIGDSIRYLGPRRDIPGLLDLADGFVLASAWEGMPLALAEAMAMEKPIVATDVGGVRELAGNCGQIVPAGDSDSLAAAMLRLMHEPIEARHALGHAARVRIVEGFSIEENTFRWEALYEKALSTRTRGA